MDTHNENKNKLKFFRKIYRGQYKSPAQNSNMETHNENKNKLRFFRKIY